MKIHVNADALVGYASARLGGQWCLLEAVKTDDQGRRWLKFRTPQRSARYIPAKRLALKVDV